MNHQPCRFAGDLEHECTRNTGQPVREHDICFAEARAQVAEQRVAEGLPAELPPSVIDGIAEIIRPELARQQPRVGLTADEIVEWVRCQRDVGHGEAVRADRDALLIDNLRKHNEIAELRDALMAAVKRCDECSLEFPTSSPPAYLCEPCRQALALIEPEREP